MPELPEVEAVARGVWSAVGGRVVERVEVRRAEVLRGDATAFVTGWAGATLCGVDRRGKQLTLHGTHGGCAVIHLGMSGRLVVLGEAQPEPAHAHLAWRLADGRRLVFADARRFGGVWAFDCVADRDARWAALGPDALAVEPRALRARACGTRGTTGLKAALLDQAVVAGLGNIYADELLWERRLHPRSAVGRLRGAEWDALVVAMRALLGRAIAAGGSTLRNYVGAAGQAGGYQLEHRAYGRGGRPCVRCGTSLRTGLIAGRTTVWCGRCQRVRGRRPVRAATERRS